jgi:hypothetical protein
LKFLILLLIITSLGFSPIFAEINLTLNTDMASYEPGELVTISGTTQIEQIVSIQVKDPTGKTLLVRSIDVDNSGNYYLDFKIPKTALHGNYIIISSVAIEMIPIIETISILIQDKVIESDANFAVSSSLNNVDESVCGTGTIMKNGKCVVDKSSEEGGGCLIATATYGSEMSQQVQQLRELRDNQLLQTESGSAFMGTFNDIYYSFSPTIADYERENPLFKEAVKLVITPMISSLSLMENVESESQVLGIGISVIMLNLGMYLGVPAIVIVGIRKIVQTN